MPYIPPPMTPTTLKLFIANQDSLKSKFYRIQALWRIWVDLGDSNLFFELATVYTQKKMRLHEQAVVSAKPAKENWKIFFFVY